MRNSRKRFSHILSSGFLLLELACLPLFGQHAKPAPKPKPSTTGSSHVEIWTSQTTGHEYRVRIEKDRLYAEWTNPSPASTKRGAYIRTVCRRVGSKWIGTSHSYLPCDANDPKTGHVTNWCHLTTRTEIEKIEPDKIIGQGESLRRFDCRTCKILETKTMEFVWVPKR